jgi:hypothetical protein
VDGIAGLSQRVRIHHLGLQKSEFKIDKSKKKNLVNFTLMAEISTLMRHLVNDLESVTERVLPVIKGIKRLLLAHGAAGAMMSGSGSTVFGLFADTEASYYQLVMPCVKSAKSKLDALCRGSADLGPAVADPGFGCAGVYCWGVVKWQDTGFWFLHSEVRILPPQPTSSNRSDVQNSDD